MGFRIAEGLRIAWTRRMGESGQEVGVVKATILYRDGRRDSGPWKLTRWTSGRLTFETAPIWQDQGHWYWCLEFEIQSDEFGPLGPPPVHVYLSRETNEAEGVLKRCEVW